MFDRSVEERLEELESEVKHLQKMRDNFLTIFERKTAQAGAFTHAISAFMILSTTLIDLIDKKKYKKEWELYKFYMFELKGKMQEIGWEIGDDFFGSFT